MLFLLLLLFLFLFLLVVVSGVHSSASVVCAVFVSSFRGDLGECCGVVGVCLREDVRVRVWSGLVCVLRRCDMAMMITG